MCPQKKGAFKYSPFVYQEVDYSNIYHEDASEVQNMEEVNAGTSIANLDQNVVVGNMNGGIYIFLATWSSELGVGGGLALNYMKCNEEKCAWVFLARQWQLKSNYFAW